MFCVWNTSMMWCVPTHRNVQDACIQHFADEVVCMICHDAQWAILSHTADIKTSTVACVMFCNEINWQHPWRMQSKNHLHRAVRLGACAWCDASGARAVFHRWISCFMVLSGYNAWIQIRVHHVVRMRSCAWCDAPGARAVFHRWISCFMVLSGCKAWIQIRLHHVVRMRSCAWTNA